MKKTLTLFLSAATMFVAGRVGQAQSTTLDSEQAAFLTLINNYRAQNGVGPLQVSVTLQQSSQWMSNDMATKNYFSHYDSLGRDPFTRMSAFGYTYYPEGENIAAGYSDAQNTFTQWQNACDPDSTGACTYAHRLNMLNSSYKAMGIGRAYGASSTYGWYWTTDFGAYVDQTVGTTPTPTGSVPTIASFTASPATITAGQSLTLSWSVSGATSITINNGVGTVTGLTSKVVTPAATTQYVLTATNTYGSKTASVTVTVNVPTTPGTTPISIWPASSAPMYYTNTGGAVELGVKFRSDVAGKITGIRFYKLTNDSGAHTGSLWSSTGQLLATGTFTGETAGGWQTLHFATPVSIAANTTYIASYHSATGTIAIGFELQSAGVNNPPLHALQNGVDGSNGVYTFGPGGAFPSAGGNGDNFWVDVLFQQ